MRTTDRFTRGFVAGGIATAVLILLDYLISVVTPEQTLFYELFEAFLYGRAATTWWGTVVAIFTQALFATAFGVVFAYLVPAVTSRSLALKGWLFGMATWFFIFTLGVFFKIPLPGIMSQATALSHIFTSSIYGLVIAWTLRYLDRPVSN